MNIKYRQMNEREITLCKEFIKKVEVLKPKNKQILEDYKRCLEDKKRGFKTQITENLRGVCL